MKKAAEYREHAAQCRSLATQMDKDEHREQLIVMAETWEKMAEERELLLGGKVDGLPLRQAFANRA